MKKKIKLSIALVILLISVGLDYQLAKIISEPKTPRQIMTSAERRSLNLYHLGNYEVVSRDAKGKVASYRFIGLNEAKPLKLEWMTDEEKTSKGLDTIAQAQVLERDDQGQIVAYRIVYKETDIVTEY